MEIWKEVVGYEGIYEVSNMGRVKVLEKNIVSNLKHNTGYYKKYEKILKQRKDINGYNKVGLTKDMKQKGMLIHRIVSIAFLSNPLNKRTVNHKNGIKTDNRVENLEWATYKENIQHYHDNNKINYYNQKKVHMYDINNNYIKTFNTIMEAEKETGVNHSGIVSVCSEKYPNRKTAGGYKWKYNKID